jgi:hypothetical protein
MFAVHCGCFDRGYGEGAYEGEKASGISLEQLAIGGKREAVDKVPRETGIEPEREPRAGVVSQPQTMPIEDCGLRGALWDRHLAS